MVLIRLPLLSLKFFEGDVISVGYSKGQDLKFDEKEPFAGMYNLDCLKR